MKDFLTGALLVALIPFIVVGVILLGFMLGGVLDFVARVLGGF